MEKACDLVGARSISDFARMAAQRLMTAGEDESSARMKSSLDLMDRFLAKLDAAIDRITAIEANGGMPPANCDAAVDESES